MHFDDRLATVLRHRAGGPRAAKTQYRQLLDLLGQRLHGRDESLLAAAWLRLGALGEVIPATDRAAIVREPSWRFENPELAAHLAEDEPAVAAAALSSAHLTSEEWETLIPRLPVRARGFLRLRRDLPAGAERILDRLGVRDRALPLPQSEEPYVLAEESATPEGTPSPTLTDPVDAVVMPFPANDAADPAPVAPQQPEVEAPAEDTPPLEAQTAGPASTPIATLVERIEAFQRNRTEARVDGAANRDSGTAPPLPFVELQVAATKDHEDGLIFTTDNEGRIDWAEEHIAPMLRYMMLGDVLPSLEQITFGRRQPLSTVPVTLEGAAAIAGDWYLDASPRFDPVGGRFVGYAGRLRRASADVPEPESDGESDRIRQLLHELRTPVNAIQGFAEVIQQQLFGPVPHEYRALAASIAGDSARMLAGFDELDRLAKLESGARELDTGTSDFSAVVGGQLKQLAEILKPRNAGFAVKLAEDCQIVLAQGDAEALSWRILAALAGTIAPSETIKVRLENSVTGIDGFMAMACDLPAKLSAREDIFKAESQKNGSGALLTPGSFGSGFALRLARAEARSIGGDLTRGDDTLMLTLPLLTLQEGDSSAEDEALAAVQPGAS